MLFGLMSVLAHLLELWHAGFFFLPHSHLPAYLVAAFIKRLSRLALTAPPEALLMVIPFICNLFRRHPACKVLMHRPNGPQGKRERGDFCVIPLGSRKSRMPGEILAPVLKFRSNPPFLGFVESQRAAPLSVKAHLHCPLFDRGPHSCPLTSKREPILAVSPGSGALSQAHTQAASTC